MLKSVYSVFLASLVCAAVFSPVPCYGNGKQEQKNTTQTGEVLVQSPMYQIDTREGLVFTGVAGKLTSRENTIQAALKDAARRLSLFYGVSGYSVIRERIVGGMAKIEAEYHLSYDMELEKYMEMLLYDSLTDIYENNNAVFVITRFYSAVSMPPYRGNSYKEERPSWVNNPPAEINGCTAGVGMASRLSSHGDTVIKSYENTVFDILKGKEINMNWTHYENNSSIGTEVSSSGEIIAAGTLTNFYVIETWTDPSSLSVWTLAVASGVNPDK